jgi:hypothetical protein
MNRQKQKLRALLEDVVPAAAEQCGPSSGDVLNLLRSARQQRRRLHTAAAALTIFAALLIALPGYKKLPSTAGVPSAPTGGASVVIRNVNDEQLFALLDGTPIGVMESPNGHRTLFVIER